MAERLGYDQPGDEYTIRNATFMLNAPPTCQHEDTGQISGQTTIENTELTEHDNTIVGVNEQQDETLFDPKPLPNHLIPAIFVTLCCFLPTGIIAIHYANEARKLEMSGNYVIAKEMSDFTRKWIIGTMYIGYFVGFAFFVGYISTG